MTGGGHTARILLLVTVPGLLVSRLPYPAVNAQTVGIVCFGVGGQAYVNNTRCPGSNACCGHRATCLSNRLCHNPGDGPEVWVRGPCAQRTFDNTCGQICLYNETEIGGGVLPRVTPCGDGSLCCNNDPQCCQNNRGVFLDENGNRVSARATAATTSYPPVGTGTERFTQTPSTSTTGTLATTTSEATTSSTTGLSPGSGGTIGVGTGGTVSGEGENTSLKVGLGLSIPLAVLLSAAAVYFWLRRRHKMEKTAETGPDGSQHMSQNTSVTQGYPGQSFTASPPPPVSKPENLYYSGQSPSAVEIGSPGVSELPSQRHYELG